MRRVLLITLSVIGLVLIVFFLVRSGSIVGKPKHTVKLSVAGYVEKFTVTDTKTNKSLGQFSEDKVSLELATGIYDLVFATSNLGSVTKRIKVPVDDSTVIAVTFTPTPTAVEALDGVIGKNEDVKTSGAKYFANNTWLVGSTISTTPGAEEVYIIVAKLLDGDWVTVDVGSFIDTDSLRLEGAPPDLISYMEEVQ